MALSAAAVVSARLAPKLEEGELIRAVQQGDQSAFEALVRSYDQSVLGLAMNLLRSPEDARDAYQEAFLRVYKNIHSFRFDCSFYTWLYRIVTNICLDHLRKRKIRKEEPAQVETSDGPIDRTYGIEEDRAAGAPERRRGNAWGLNCGIIRACACGLSGRSSIPPKRPLRIACSAPRRKCARFWEIS